MKRKYRVTHKDGEKGEWMDAEQFTRFLDLVSVGQQVQELPEVVEFDVETAEEPIAV